MHLRVGPYVYRVEFVHGYIHHEGQPCLGLCDNDQHVIYVSDRTGQPQQIQVLCHEYMEAWLYHFAVDGAEKERTCDLFGLAMTQFIVDFVHHLRQMSPEGLGAGEPVEDDSQRQWVIQVFDADAASSGPASAAEACPESAIH